jgi:hypothetical protein
MCLSGSMRMPRGSNYASAFSTLVLEPTSCFIVKIKHFALLLER